MSEIHPMTNDQRSCAENYSSIFSCNRFADVLTHFSPSLSVTEPFGLFINCFYVFGHILSSGVLLMYFGRHCRELSTWFLQISFQFFLRFFLRLFEVTHCLCIFITHHHVFGDILFEECRVLAMDFGGHSRELSTWNLQACLCFHELAHCFHFCLLHVIKGPTRANTSPHSLNLDRRVVLHQVSIVLIRLHQCKSQMGSFFIVATISGYQQLCDPLNSCSASHSTHHILYFPHSNSMLFGVDHVAISNSNQTFHRLRPSLLQVAATPRTVPDTLMSTSDFFKSLFFSCCLCFLAQRLHECHCVTLNRRPHLGFFRLTSYGSLK
mmetsp:Transcript_35779/g.42111  ORF Transcript_35779/g.42111 Transcript_35779/m.42111 type:complete len:323 (-) Transcript_35779:1039-2007(-)